MVEERRQDAYLSIATGSMVMTWSSMVNIALHEENGRVEMQMLMVLLADHAIIVVFSCHALTKLNVGSEHHVVSVIEITSGTMRVDNPSQPSSMRYGMSFVQTS